MQIIAWQICEMGVEMAPGNFDISRLFTYYEKKVKKDLAGREPLAEPYRLCQQNRAL